MELLVLVSVKVDVPGGLLRSDIVSFKVVYCRHGTDLRRGSRTKYVGVWYRVFFALKEPRAAVRQAVSVEWRSHEAAL
jgi:hypothetical protein